MKYHSILDVVGNTPLVAVPFEGFSNIYAKLEYLNPGGSIKDRTAKFMIEQAEKSGQLKPGGTIIEASSGNQGISAAMIGAVKGYKVIITASSKVSAEKLAAIRAYGATVIICPPTPRFGDPENYYTKAVEIHRSTPGSVLLNQFFNPDNIGAHYGSLGPNLWKQSEEKIAHFIAGAGSCGTLSGAGRYLKGQNNSIKIIGVDAAQSYRSTQGSPKPYAVEGLGVDYDTPLLDKEIIDDFIAVSDVDAIGMLKILSRKFGLLVGPASGAVAHAAYCYAQTVPSNEMIVMLFGDSGRAYLTKNFYHD